MTKALASTNWNSKTQSENTGAPPKPSITQRFRSDLGPSVEVTTANQLVWLNRFKGSQPSHLLQKLSNQKDTYLIIYK